MEKNQITNLSHLKEILLPTDLWQEIKSHCRRKLAGEYLPGETEVKRAYGLLAGKVHDQVALVEKIFIFKKNARMIEPLKTYMDNVMAKYAVASKTPLSQRGWITDPEELRKCYDMCDGKGLLAIGTYHMHIVPWDHDPLRDTPTKLDMVLAKNTNMYCFIVSLVDPSKPIIRAFYEGMKEQEVPIVFT